MMDEVMKDLLEALKTLIRHAEKQGRSGKVYDKARAAIARAEAALVEPDSLHAGEPVAARSDEDKARLRKALDAELQRPPTRDEVIRMALKAGFTWEPINNIADPLERFATLVLEADDGPWKTAVIDQLVIAHILTAEHESDPLKAIQDLLAYHTEIAVDPRVSGAAATLVEQAKAEEREACIAITTAAALALIRGTTTYANLAARGMAAHLIDAIRARGKK